MATWLLGTIAFAVVAACVYRLLVAGEAKEPPADGVGQAQVSANRVGASSSSSEPAYS